MKAADPIREHGGHSDVDGAGIERPGDLQPDLAVDRALDALRGREIGIAQREANVRSSSSAKSTSCSTRAPDGITPEVGTPCVTDSRVPLRLEAARDHRPLRHRIDVAIGGEQGRQHEGAAKQALGVADGGNGRVDLGARAGEGRQGRRHDHGGDVLGLDVLAFDVDAQPLEQIDQQILGEGDAAQRIPGPVQADDEAVADQVVAAHALDVDDVLDAHRRGAGGARRRQHERQRRQQEESAAADGPGVGAAGAHHRRYEVSDSSFIRAVTM